METALAPWIQSSQDATQVANKVRGAILFSSSALIFGAALFFHVQLNAADIITLGTELGAVAGAIWTIYGFILHVVTWFGTIKPNGAGGGALV